MTDAPTLRPALATDTDACADILNTWIDTRDWMPRVHTPQAVRDFYRDFVFPRRDLFVADDQPRGLIQGFMALDRDDAFVTALYVAQPGRGLGKRFLDLAKSGRETLRLWTFQANVRARAFYAREGFVEERRTDGDNEEGLPDVLLRWGAP